MLLRGGRLRYERMKIFMAKTQAVHDQCPIEVGLNILSGKWKLKILWHLSKGTIRFNELQRLLGDITTKTLTGQLRELEEQGIVVRKVFPEVPPKVEYSLSDIGITLNPILSQLCDWGKTYHTYMET
jgi:DNA-binding HxlR family transcriptional regulator